MTIRLKLTLIYTIILTLVVIVFSVLLYSFQSQTTLNIVAGRLERDYRMVTTINLRERDAEPPPNPGERIPNNFNPSLVQIRNEDETVVYQSENLGDAVLPLSEAGSQVVAKGQVWLERVTLDGEWFLIRSQLGETEQAVPAIVQVATSVSNETEYLNGLRSMLVIGDAIVIIVAFGLGWTFAGLTLRPIQRITQTAQAVGEERDFTRRVAHIGPDDEIGRLATTFNVMLAQLQDAYVRVEQTLQAQRRFVADASHELRTPLTTIRGNMELLQHQPVLDAEERTDILADAIDETNRLMRLVSDLLTLARTDARQTVQLEQVSVRALLDEVCRQAQMFETDHTVLCHTNVDLCHTDVDMTVLGNADALKQVLLILLDNAFKHTPPATTITVSTVCNDDKVEIHVQDNGPGIDVEQLPHVFERFYRGNMTRTGAGTGLGLSIAKELMTAQGGTVTVDSLIGKGSTFTLHLSVSASREAVPQNG